MVRFQKKILSRKNDDETENTYEQTGLVAPSKCDVPGVEKKRLTSKQWKNVKKVENNVKTAKKILGSIIAESVQF